MKYTNQKCQICNAKILEGDDAVICPDCGAPYHKECYKSSGHCAYEDKHAEGFEFKLEKEKGESAGDKICTRCGSENPTDATNCQICGYPTLQNKKEGRDYHKKVNSLDDDDNTTFKNINLPGGSRIHIIGAGYDSLGGVPKDSKIDGESAADVATVVGQNTNYYMPKFKNMSEQKKKASWNWPAFLIPHIWFFFRKCYLQGAAAFMITIALNLVFTFTGNRVIELIGAASATEPITAVDLINMINSAMQNSELAPKLIYLSVISFIALIIMIGVNVIWGVFANYIYKQKVIDTVRDKNEMAKEENLSGNERIMLLGKSGGVNLILPLIVLLFSSEIVELIYLIIVGG